MELHMGTDIHYLFQKKDSVGEWEDLDLDQGFHKNPETGEYEDGEYYINRHYLLFAALAGVRNGFGFAGVYRHEPLDPIAEGRGIPEDMKPKMDDNDYIEKEYKSSYLQDCVEPTFWLGDHSHTWATGSEILAWFDNASQIEEVGIITVEDYWKFIDSGRQEPEVSSGGVWGANIQVYDETKPDTLPFNLIAQFKQSKVYTHVRVKWKTDVSKPLDYFRKMIQKLVDEHGEIRMVMGFDS